MPGYNKLLSAFGFFLERGTGIGVIGATDQHEVCKISPTFESGSGSAHVRGHPLQHFAEETCFPNCGDSFPMSSEWVQIGDWKLNTHSNILRHRGSESHLEHKQVQLLLFLLAYAGKTVKKNDLIKQVWSGRVVVDDVLSVAVSQLRKAFGDNARAPTFIKTIPGEGYQFIHPIDVAEVDKARQNIGLEPIMTPPAEEPHPPVLDFNGSKHYETEALFFPPSARPGRLKWLAGIVLVPVIVVLAYRFTQPVSHAEDTTYGSAPTFAVLPLETYSDNPALEKYSDTLTEVLISELAKNTNFSVISRTSVMGFKGQQKSLPEIAQKLKADLVLEGAILESSGQMEVSLQLINARTDHHVWADRFNVDPNRNEAYLIAAKTLDSIVEEIPEGKKEGVVFHSRTPTEEAQELYLQAEALSHSWQQEKMREAMKLLEEAIKKDESFAQAYILLAYTKRNILFREPLVLYKASDDIKALLHKAIEIEPSSVEAHFMLASILFSVDWNLTEAERYYRKTLELNRNHVDAHNGYAQLLLAVGNFPGAHQQIQIVRDLDPLAYSVPVVAWIYTMERRYEQAWGETNKLLALNPDSIAYHRSAQTILEYMGREQESYQHLKRMLELNKYSAEEIEQVEKQFATGGLQAVYHWLAFTKHEINNIGQYDPPVSLARYAVMAGRKDEALTWLEQAFHEHRFEVIWIAVDPKYNSLHGEPRFKALLKKIGLSLPEANLEITGTSFTHQAESRVKANHY